MRFTCIIALVLVLTTACSNDDDSALKITGSGQYNFTSYPPFANKPIRCFYHIPENSSPNTPILLAVHGAGRDGAGLRNGLIDAANERGFIVLATEFSDDHFPGSNAFNLANIFTNGENPSAAGLQAEEYWTFSVFDPVFQDFKAFVGSNEVHYDLFGHSAGAQLVHRYLMFAPEAGFNRLISSAAGWYMMPDPVIDFPYGLGQSPAVQVDPVAYFQRRVLVVVGEMDTDPNSFNLRHTPQADAQGMNRVERAQHFHQRSSLIADSLSIEFQWLYREAPGLGHDAAALANFASSLLY